MQQKPSSLNTAIKSGLLGGVISLLICLVGIVPAFEKKYLIDGIFTMGQFLVFAPILFLSYGVARKIDAPSIHKLIYGLLTGLFGGLVLGLFVGLTQFVNLRAILVNASPALLGILTFSQSIALGLPLLIVVSGITGVVAAGAFTLPVRIRSALFQAILWVFFLGLLRDLIITVMQRWGQAANLFKWLFSKSGMSPIGAGILFVIVAGLVYWRFGKTSIKARLDTAPPNRRTLVRWGLLAASATIFVFLPPILGPFFSEILTTVGIYILMGLGLNIVVGFAGLLDLGYVAFYAIGAYTLGVLTSPELIANPLSFWAALPFALLASVLSGVLLGTPVLKMRGDYLAIVTLGFGEIIRILALSDWLRPYIGGSQGIQQIAHPIIFGYEIVSQQQLYYLLIVAIAFAGFISWRLKDSRLGRSWMAVREDEDVAVAQGINPVTTKLLAFATGAFFSGLSGAIFAAKLGSTYPHSFNLLVSINVLALIIIGGMGSIPGVFVGALVLLGLPELLREFADYRYLVYGAVLVAMMLLKPEGLWPEARRKLELHEDEIIPVPELISTKTSSGK
ncbi:MAG: leucine/isoleucine/valine transporter permease subunit [Chloroflexota bacterium]